MLKKYSKFLHLYVKFFNHEYNLEQKQLVKTNSLLIFPGKTVVFLSFFLINRPNLLLHKIPLL